MITVYLTVWPILLTAVLVVDVRKVVWHHYIKKWEYFHYYDMYYFYHCDNYTVIIVNGKIWHSQDFPAFVSNSFCLEGGWNLAWRSSVCEVVCVWRHEHEHVTAVANLSLFECIFVQKDWILFPISYIGTLLGDPFTSSMDRRNNCSIQ